MNNQQKKLFIFLDFLNEEEELYRLRRFVQSDFFNLNERLKQLFEAICTAKTGLKQFEDIDAEALYRTTFPDKKEKHLKTDFSDLLKLVKQYMAYEEYRFDELARKRYLLEALNSRKANKQFELLLSRELKALDSTKESGKYSEDPQTYLHHLLLSNERYKYYNIHHNRAVSANQTLQELAYSIERFYALMKTRFNYVMKGREVLLGHPFDYGDTEAVQKIVTTTPLEEFPLLHTANGLFRMWNEASFQSFDELTAIFYDYGNLIAPYEQQQLLQTLINYCRFKVLSEPPANWNLRQQELYAMMFEKGFCYVGKGHRRKKVSHHHYRNYLQLLLEIRQIETAKTFKLQYEKQLLLEDKKQKSFVLHYSEISIFFAGIHTQSVIAKAHHLEKAIENIKKMEQKIFLGNVKEPDLFYRILFEILTLKTYYEKQEGFLSRRENFQHYIRNQIRFSPNYRRAYLNFASFVLRLYKLKVKSKSSPTALRKLLADIRSMKTVERGWLVDKIGEL